MCDREQVIERQQQGAAQVHDHDFLGRSQLGLQAVCCVRAVTKDLMLFLFVGGLLGIAEALGQDTGGAMAGRDLGAHGWFGTGVLVQGDQHDLSLPVDCRDPINSLNTARAMNSG